MFLICTRIKYRQAAACSAARGCVGAHLVATCFRPHAGCGTHTHAHTTTRRRPARLLHEQKRACTSALLLHGRRACAGPCCSSAGRLTPSRGPLDGRLCTLAPTARRRRRARLAAARGPTAAAAAAAATAAAELLGSAPTMAAAADRPPVRIERRLLQPPRPAPAWPNAGREHRAGRRARRVGGVPTSAAGGARAQMPWRMIRDTSSSLEIDGPAHARAVRGVEVMGSEDNKHEEQGRMRGKGRERG
jgi:hypothetical protein